MSINFLKRPRLVRGFFVRYQFDNWDGGLYIGKEGKTNE